MVGLIGLDVTLGRILKEDISEEEAVRQLFAAVSKENYIPPGAINIYRQALLEEYRKLKTGMETTTTGLSIKILGPACVSCNRLNTLVFDILQEMGVAADIEQIHELDEIWRQGVLTTPALIINGAIVASGRLPSRSEVEAWLRGAIP